MKIWDGFPDTRRSFHFKRTLRFEFITHFFPHFQNFVVSKVRFACQFLGHHSYFAFRYSTDTISIRVRHPFDLINYLLELRQWILRYTLWRIVIIRHRLNIWRENSNLKLCPRFDNPKIQKSIVEVLIVLFLSAMCLNEVFKYVIRYTVLANHF